MDCASPSDPDATIPLASVPPRPRLSLEENLRKGIQEAREARARGEIPIRINPNPPEVMPRSILRRPNAASWAAREAKLAAYEAREAAMNAGHAPVEPRRAPVEPRHAPVEPRKNSLHPVSTVETDALPAAEPPFEGFHPIFTRPTSNPRMDSDVPTVAPAPNPRRDSSVPVAVVHPLRHSEEPTEAPVLNPSASDVMTAVVRPRTVTFGTVTCGAPPLRTNVANHDFLPEYGRTGDSERRNSAKSKLTGFASFILCKMLTYESDAEERGEDVKLNFPKAMRMFDDEWKALSAEERTKWKQVAKINNKRPEEEHLIHWSEIDGDHAETPRETANAPPRVTTSAPPPRREYPASFYEAPAQIDGEVFVLDSDRLPQDQFLHGSAIFHNRVRSEYQSEDFALNMRRRLEAQEARELASAEALDRTVDTSYVASDGSTDISIDVGSSDLSSNETFDDAEESDTTVDLSVASRAADSTCDSMPTLEDATLDESVASASTDSPAKSDGASEDTVSHDESPAKSSESSSSSADSSPNKTSAETSSSGTSTDSSSSSPSKSDDHFGASGSMDERLAYIDELIRRKKNKEAESPQSTSDEESPRKANVKQSETSKSSEEASDGASEKTLTDAKDSGESKEESSEESEQRGEPEKPTKVSSEAPQTDARALAVSKLADSISQMATAMTQMAALTEKMMKD